MTTEGLGTRAMEFIEDLKATKAKVELGNKALRLLPENFSMSDMMYDPSGDPELKPELKPAMADKVVHMHTHMHMLMYG